MKRILIFIFFIHLFLVETAKALDCRDTELLICSERPENTAGTRGKSVLSVEYNKERNNGNLGKPYIGGIELVYP